MLYHSWLVSFHRTHISVNGPFVELILPAPRLIHLPRPKQGGAVDGEESTVGVLVGGWPASHYRSSPPGG
ncbi:unnamed protein product [Gulo gulo]|uniref:Uncharacterized protein n=1 Tax=Gulo gulo TaxID=48420 RepID=A0A9X9M7F4_GULGU|nr:unnamed protein product [Gulo gulo]